MILRAIATIGTVEDSRWEKKEDEEQHECPVDGKGNGMEAIPELGDGCPQGIVTPRENFWLMTKVQIY